MPATTDYPKVIRRAQWHEAGVGDVRLFTVELKAPGGALSRVPRGLGRALSTVIEGRSVSDGLDIDGAWLRIEALR
jgi:hypothetical protein